MSIDDLNLLKTMEDTVQQMKKDRSAMSVPSVSVPFACPVCHGQGTVSRPPYIAGDMPFWSGSTTNDSYPCRACDGTGIIWRKDT